MARMYRDIFPRLTTFENLYRAFRDAAKGKRGRVSVASFEWDLEHQLLALQRELESGMYRPGPYTSFYIRDPKRRLISAAPFRDRVVHHALCQTIEPLFERTFIGDSYANRLGKGNHAALVRAQHFARAYPFVLQCDIKQFFPSVDHSVLTEILARKLGDERLMELIAVILEGGAGVLDTEYTIVHFPGDDLLAVTRPRGLPIGNLTSQFWANVYLNELDQFVKRSLRCRPYVRYMDDFLLFSHNKRELWGWKCAIRERLCNLRLCLHERSSTVYPVGNGIPFLGFRIFPSHMRLKRRNGLAFARRLRKHFEEHRRGALSREALDQRIQGWIAHASHGDTWGLRKALLARPQPIRQEVTRSNEAIPDFLAHL